MLPVLLPVLLGSAADFLQFAPDDPDPSLTSIHPKLIKLQPNYFLLN
jgi:hypothetical protein